ncbi:MAG: ATPase domain-containing protein [Candidatus Thermoplasmatota archaeon]|nr:ATPase domain-containing protein [Candidatus Thermoplasmatota archaeon]
MTSIERVKTYIKGLDEIMSGGVPRRNVILIVGQPGTMKSSLGYYILYKNAKHEGKRGVHISLEQSRASLAQAMTNMGMGVTPEVGDKISILDLGFIRKKMTQLSTQTWLEVFKMYTQNLKENMDFDILVLDSLPVLETLARFGDPREDLFHFFEWLKDMDITTFVIHEMPQGTEQFAQNGEDFLSDGIIHLDLRRDHETVNLFLSIMKMRSTKHKRGYFPLIYDKKGFEIVTR